MKYLYDAKTNAFYPFSLQSDYESAGSWPDSGVEIDEETFSHFQLPPQGKIRIAGEDGYPAWGDIPPRTHNELVAEAEQYRSGLLTHADAVTADWRTELALGEISEPDKAALSAWMAYKREVKAVSANDAVEPDFKWPSPPQ